MVTNNRKSFPQVPRDVTQTEMLPILAKDGINFKYPSQRPIPQALVYVGPGGGPPSAGGRPAPSRLLLVVGAGGAVGGLAGFGGLGELLRHRLVALGELLDGKGIGLVVRQAEVVFGADQGVLDLLKVRDGLVDFVDGGLELLAGQTVIAAEGLLERIQLAFEMGHVHALAAGDLQFFLDADRLLGGIDQQSDDRPEELWTDHVHLGVAVGNIDNAPVI